MLIPLTRAKFEQIVPLIATSAQYHYYWGKWSDLIRRLLISAVAMMVALLLGQVLGSGVGGLRLLLCVGGGLYWLWAPIYWASRRNATCRRYPYSGFWRGRVKEVYVTEVLIGEEQSVNQRGELVITENRERRINLVIEDETGFQTMVQGPLKRIYQAIAPHQVAELVVLSKYPDLSSIALVTDVYIPRRNLWVGDYPYLQRDVFEQVSQELSSSPPTNPSARRSEGPKRRRPYGQYY